MKAPKTKMISKAAHLFLILGLITFASSVQAALVAFDFANGGELDSSQPAGTTMSRTDNGETVILTTVVLSAPDYNDGDPYNNLITTGVDSNINNPNGLGVNNPSIANSAFDTLTGVGGSESTNLNHLESITIEFDREVTITTIDFASLNTTGEFVRINVEGVGTDYDFNQGAATNDIFTDPLSGLVITAGTDITFTGLGGPTVANARIDTFTVDVIPEPSSVAMLLGGVGMLTLRRRRRLS